MKIRERIVRGQGTRLAREGAWLWTVGIESNGWRGEWWRGEWAAHLWGGPLLSVSFVSTTCQNYLVARRHTVIGIRILGGLIAFNVAADARERGQIHIFVLLDTFQ